MRVETVLTTLDRQVLTCYKLACLLSFYGTTAAGLIPTERASNLGEVLADLHSTALKVCSQPSLPPALFPWLPLADLL